MKVQKAIEIRARPTKIWPYFVEPEKVLQWYSTFKKFEYTGRKRTGVGTTLYVEEQSGPSQMKIHYKVTAWKKNEKVALQMVSGSGVKSYRQAWTLKPTRSGTRFTFFEEVELPLGILGKLIGLIAQGMSESTVDSIQLKLKSLVEA